MTSLELAVRSLWRKGRTSAEIAEYLDITPAHVREILYDLNLI